jgi:hypothetical protein
MIKPTIARITNDVKQNRYYKEKYARLFGFLYVYIIVVYDRSFHFLLFIFKNRINHYLKKLIMFKRFQNII